MSRHPLVILGVIAIFILAFYFFASPFQNCVRDMSEKNPSDDDTTFNKGYCSTRTSW